MTAEELNICNQMISNHKELLRGFENGPTIVAEAVGDSFYSSKISGVLAEIPDDAFLCVWRTEPTETEFRYNTVEVIFAPDKGNNKLLWLYETQMMKDGTRRATRRLDYTTSSFDSWE